MKKKHLCSLLALIASWNATAQVYELAYTDTANAHRVTLASTQYINPTGAVTIRTVAGLDRKIHLTVKNSDTGTTVLDQTSGLITVSDRITSEADSSAFYGKAFSVSSMPEANYTITSSILDANSNVVSTTSYPYLVDTTKLTAASFGWSAWAHPSTNLADNAIIAPYEQYLFWVTMNSDASGIASATFEGRDPSTGTALTHTSASIDIVAGQAYIGNGSMGSVVNGEHLPAISGIVNATFIVTDKAGNTSELIKPVKWVGGSAPTPLYEVVGVKQNNSYAGNFLAGSPFTGYTAYYSGITTDLNPIPVVIRVKKTNWWAYNEYGYSIGNGSSSDSGDAADYEDSTYVYKKLNGLSDANGKCYSYDFTGYRVRRLPFYSEGFPCHNVALSDAAPKNPVGVSYQVQWQHLGWTTALGGYYNKPWVLTGIKATVEARTYDQIVAYRSASCTVPAGQTSCEASLNSTIASGSTAQGDDAVLYVRSSDGVLRATLGVNRLLYDPVAPTISSVSYDGEKTITVVGNKSNYGSLWGSSRVDSGGVKLLAYNSISGETTTLSVSGFSIDSSGNFSGTFSTASLPDGQYTFTASVTDTYSSNVTKALSGTVVIDSSAPTITFSGVTSGSIAKIDSLLVKVTDGADASPVVTAVSLVGGPIADNLSLGFSKQSDGYYHLEAPRMFPSTSDTEGYTIKVTAQDSQSNVATASMSFLLTPENLVALGTIKGLAVNKNLLDSSNKPLTYAKITTVKTAAGATATGAQLAYFTLRRDAAFAVIVNGVTVQPGQSKEFTLTLDNTGGAVLPIYPAVSGKTGNASFMIDIPQLVAN